MFDFFLMSFLNRKIKGIAFDFSVQKGHYKSQTFSNLSIAGLKIVDFFCRERCLNIDSNTLQALQIFACDDHPSVLGKGKAKEGLSLFGIMDHTVCLKIVDV